MYAYSRLVLSLWVGLLFVVIALLVVPRWFIYVPPYFTDVDGDSCHCILGIVMGETRSDAVVPTLRSHPALQRAEVYTATRRFSQGRVFEFGDDLIFYAYNHPVITQSYLSFRSSNQLALGSILATYGPPTDVYLHLVSPATPAGYFTFAYPGQLFTVRATTPYINPMLDVIFTETYDQALTQVFPTNDLFSTAGNYRADWLGLSSIAHYLDDPNTAALTTNYLTFLPSEQ